MPLAEVRRIAAAHGGSEVEKHRSEGGCAACRSCRCRAPSDRRENAGSRCTHWCRSRTRPTPGLPCVHCSTRGAQTSIGSACRSACSLPSSGSNAFVLETGVLLAAPRTLYYERVLDATTRARFEDFPPSPEAEALVMELRGELTRLFMERGAAHLQIGEPIVTARDCAPNRAAARSNQARRRSGRLGEPGSLGIR